MSADPRIAVIGLGYVGLPLAIALARHYALVGLDIDGGRVNELRAGRDRTNEVEPGNLAATAAEFTTDPERIRGADLFIITVPTPVGAGNKPDLGAVLGACETIGGALVKGALVVLESTVYPGATEEVCGPALERASGLVCGEDFHLGYSPERINPGDRQHTLDAITKVVAGQTPAVAERLEEVYGKINGGNVFVARDIRTAEAAKVIENAQRDINIAFVNEITMIFNKLGISVYDVLEAAETKWNFLPFRPGLVGGHCIGVDPYYLAHKAEEIGHHPEIVLAGRRINDGMGEYVAADLDRELGGHGGGARILVLGLTFKENVPDLRNSKVIDIVTGLARRGYTVEVHDPLADPEEAAAIYDVDLKTDLSRLGGYDAIVGAVPHAAYTALAGPDLAALLVPGGLVADVKGMWRGVALPDGVRRWAL